MSKEGRKILLSAKDSFYIIIFLKTLTFVQGKGPHRSVWSFVMGNKERAIMISVIVPYKDSELWLGRCCESLHEQSGDFEFILVNDHSEDGGQKIVDFYTEVDDRFRSIVNARGNGVSGARNTGLDIARGEWITFLDADDELLSNAYRTMMSVVDSDRNMIQFNHLRYYTRIDKLTLKYTNEGGTYTLPTLPVHWFGVWNKLFRAEFVKDIRFDESLQYGEDGLFIFECLAKDGTIYHANRKTTTVKHRFDNKNSLSQSKTLPDVVKQLRAYEDFLLRQDGADVRVAVCKEMAKLWDKLAETINL